MYKQFFCEDDKSKSLIIETCNGCVYAYLLNHREIVGEVWLYNETYDPDYNEWEISQSMPFKNSLHMIKHPIIKISDSNKIFPIWLMQNGKFLKLEIHYNSVLMAILKEGSKPGYSINALKDGPCALANPNF